MVNAITKSVPKVFGRITRVGMAASLMTAQLLVAIIGVNQFPGSASALSLEKFATVASSNGTVVTGEDWENVNNALANDSNRAKADLDKDDASELLLLTGFGFNLPADATVDGIEFKVSRFAEKDNRIKDNYVTLVKSGTLVANASLPGDWPKDEAAVTYGGPTNLWSQTWTPADINSATFGVGVSAKASKDAEAYVNYISITVHYTEAPTPPIEPPVSDDEPEEVPEEDPETEAPEAPPLEEEGRKVTICHRTNSITNPYRRITVSVESLNGGGNNDHTQHNEYGIFDPAVHTKSGDDWADIIPPVLDVVEGLNWTTQGAAIWYNDCFIGTKPSTGTVIIKKLINPTSSQEKFGFISEALDMDETEQIGHNQTIERTNVPVGEAYSVTEYMDKAQADIFVLESISCTVPSEDVSQESVTDEVGTPNLLTRTVTFPVIANVTTTCVFVNTQTVEEEEPGTVNVTKYEDFDRDGERDEDEPVLEGWEITLNCTSYPSQETDFTAQLDPGSDCEEQSEITGEDGEVTFDELDTGKWYEVDEKFNEGQENWEQTGIECDIFGEVILADVRQDIVVIPSNVFYLTDDMTVNCEIGNARDIVLQLAKFNDAPTPKVVGNVVTYTLVVTHPEDSSVSYDTVVTDLPPENFKYNGVYTFELTTASPDRVDPLNVPDPNYQSPGSWSLGTVYPGEVITLTYQTVINNQVSPGDYPDVAFVRGYTTPNEGAVEVLGNSAENPFVQTDVTVVLGQTIGNVSFQPTTAVLGALINTGEKPHPLHYLLPITLVLNALLLVRMASRTSVEKGAK